MGTEPAQTPPDPSTTPRKRVQPIRFSESAWEWVREEAMRDGISAPELVRRVVDEARLRREIDVQVMGRITSLEGRVTDLEQRRDNAKE